MTKQFESSLFNTLSTCANGAGVRNYFIIVTSSFSKNTKGFFFFCLTIDLQKMPLGKLRVVCIRYSSTTKSKPAKKIWGVVFLFNWKWHAKFQALLQKKEKLSLSMVLHSPLQFLWPSTEWVWILSETAHVHCKQTLLLILPAISSWGRIQSGQFLWWKTDRKRKHLRGQTTETYIVSRSEKIAKINNREII